MTRSILSPHSPQVTKKVFRSTAKQAGIPFREAALKRTAVLAEQKIYPNSSTARHSRVDGTYLNSAPSGASRKVHGEIVGPYVHDDYVECFDDICPICEEEWARRGAQSGDGNSPSNVVLGSLLDIAKPAKVKGVAKEFEVVDRLPRVIVLPDSTDYWEQDWASDEDEGWEDIYSHAGPSERRYTYSSVLKGTG